MRRFLFLVLAIALLASLLILMRKPPVTDDRGPFVRLDDVLPQPDRTAPEKPPEESAEVFVVSKTGEVVIVEQTAETGLETPRTAEVQIPRPPDAGGAPGTVAGIATPAGYRRLSFPEKSYAEFIRTLPLRKSLAIETFNGGRVPDSHYRRLAVVDLPLLFKADLEQCADWAMRLRAEFFKRHQKDEDLVLFRYDGTPRRYRPGKERWESFMRTAFANSNSHSLKAGCDKVRPDDLRPGDLVVQNSTGGIGHVCVVMDACENRQGERMYLFGFSFMPAQAFHIEDGQSPWGHSGWFPLAGFIDFLNHYFPYGTPVLRRFP